MREILFRGKTTKKPDGHELNEVWVDGDLVCAMGRFYIHPKSNGFRTTGELAKLVCLHEVDPSTVGQYTGLTDKNGKLIYEGDIVQYPIEQGSFRGSNDHEVVFERRGESAYYGIRMSPIETWPFGMEVPAKLMVVIGNIHDNPELLEVRNG